MKQIIISVSHTTDDLVFEWFPVEDQPLVVEPLQLPQVIMMLMLMLMLMMMLMMLMIDEICPAWADQEHNRRLHRLLFHRKLHLSYGRLQIQGMILIVIITIVVIIIVFVVIIIFIILMATSLVLFWCSNSGIWLKILWSQRMDLFPSCTFVFVTKFSCAFDFNSEIILLSGGVWDISCFTHTFRLVSSSWCPGYPSGSSQR